MRRKNTTQTNFATRTARISVVRVLSRASKERARHQAEENRTMVVRRRHVIEAIVAGLLAAGAGVVAMMMAGTI